MKRSIFLILYLQLTLTQPAVLAMGMPVRELCINSLIAAASAQPLTPEAALRKFYHWYVHALNQNLEPLGKQKAALKKYLTRRLYLELVKRERRGEIDSDYFLDAQDWDHDWENNIAISKPSLHAGRAIALVDLTGREMSIKLRVTLKKEAGGWKIDKVSTGSPS